MRSLKRFSLIISFLILQNSIAQDKPNVLFIFADDMTFEAINSINNKEVLTPNLDRLAKNGTFFSHAFNQGSWDPAVCLASRTMLNTGMFLWNARNSRFTHDVTKPEKKFNVPSWGSLMKKAGYQTYMTGKWHVHTDAKKIFDTVKDLRPGMPNQVEKRYERQFIEGEPDTWSPYDKSNNGYWKGGKHWSEIVGDHAISFLNNSKEKENPFFMYVAFNAPHDPRQSPKKYVDMYPLKNIAVPETFMAEYPYADAAASPKTLRDERLAPTPRTEYAIKVNRQEYYAIITHMDAQIGRILDALEASGKAANTYIIFTSDHGLAVGDHGFIGKQNMYDSSIRVPFIISGKGVKKGATVDEFIYLQDAMATSLDIAAITKPSHVKFNSVLSLAKGNQKKSSYSSVYGAYLKNQRMVRTKDYKMIFYPTIQKIRLYHIQKDPNELNDLAPDPNYKPIIRKLYKKFLILQKETGDTLDSSQTFSFIEK